MIQTSQPKLMLYVIIALGFIGGYVYYTQGAVDTIEVPVVFEEKDSIDKLKDVKIDFSKLDNPKIKSLKTFGQIPVVPGQTGKKDIFAPVQ